MHSVSLKYTFKKTGVIWRKSPAIRVREVASVCTALSNAYGTPRFGNPTDPLDDLIFIILSNKTGPAAARKTYRDLRRRFPRWDNILSAPLSTLESILKPAGLSAVKSRQIRAALYRIKKEFGRCNLNALKRTSADDAEDFLVGLPGASEKVAKCVMMYTLHLGVLPVDTHVHRISSRLGWTARRRADQCHAELEALVLPALRRNFHVACIAHGRKVCRPRSPQCHDCCINRYCEFYKDAR
jgi:endonuclease III